MEETPLTGLAEMAANAPRLPQSAVFPNAQMLASLLPPPAGAAAGAAPVLDADAGGNAGGAYAKFVWDAPRPYMVLTLGDGREVQVPIQPEGVAESAGGAAGTAAAPATTSAAAAPAATTPGAVADGSDNMPVIQRDSKKPRLYPCSMCDARFTDRQCLKKHIRGRHERVQYNCEYCGKGLWSAWNCKRHTDEFCKMAPPEIVNQRKNRKNKATLADQDLA